MLKEIKHELVKFLSVLKNENFDGVTELSQDSVKISEQKIGGKVEIIGQDGKLSNAPDGEYKLGDFQFTVKAGLIESIAGDAPKEVPAKMDNKPAPNEPAEPTEAPEAPEQADLDALAAIADLKAETDSIKQDIESIKAMLAEFANKSDVSQFKNEVVKLNKTIEKLAKLPAEFSKTTTSNIVKDKQEDKMNEFLKIFNK